MPEGDEINLLTIIPNETYETFAAQYQEQIKEIYGTADAGSNLRKKHKGKDSKNRITRTPHYGSDEFKAFWKKLARKTDYTVTFDEGKVIERAIAALNKLVIADYEAEVVQTRIRSIAADSIKSDELGRMFENLRAHFTPLDLVEELSENTALSYRAAHSIVSGIENLAAVTKNPPKFLADACALIRDIELDEMMRTLSYHPTGESIPLSEFRDVIDTFLPVESATQRGVYDGVAWESAYERSFTKDAERDNEVVCFLKLPACYKIPTPIGRGNEGFYEPDFGLILRRRNIKSGKKNEYYFVIETKSTKNLADRKELTESERLKIRCAIKHFEALGVEAKLDYLPYVAPVKEYEADFKTKVPKP